MHKFERGDHVRALEPDGAEVLIGKFLGCAAADEAISVELEWASPTAVDAAWMEIDDGSTRKVALHQMRPTYWQPTR